MEKENQGCREKLEEWNSGASSTAKRAEPKRVRKFENDKQHE